jgi:SulP family sulfate permease
MSIQTITTSAPPPRWCNFAAGRQSSRGGKDDRSSGALASLRLKDICAGAICSILSVAYSLSYASLIFSGPLSAWLGYGIAVSLVSAAVAALVVGLRSSLPFAIAGPDAPTSAVLAALVANFANRLLLDGAATHLPQHAIIAMALATALTGMVLLLLGVIRAGRAIRFVPYPVIGGFLGATGWLIFIGGLQLATGEQVTLENASSLLDSASVAKLAAGAVVAIALFVGRRFLPSSLTVPGLLLAGVAVVHLARLSLGIPLSQAQASGWMFRLQSQIGLASPWHGDTLVQFPWKALFALSGDFLSVIFVTTIAMLLNTTGIELAARREADLDQELKSHGVANLVIAALGGVIGITSMSRTTANYLAGARGRLSAMTVAAALVAVIGFDSGFLGYVPKCVLGGLLLFLGAELLYRWLVDSARQLAYVEYISLVAIALIIIASGFVAGLLIGVVIGCATFAFSASRIPAIKFSFNGSEYRSSLDRAPEELAVLTEHGHELQGMRLQGYLFFGSASRLHEHIKALLAMQPACRFLLFDLRLVTGIDSSATHSFKQIKQAAGRCGARLVLVNMTREVAHAFRLAEVILGDVLVVDDLDRALELCENAIIRVHQMPGSDAKSLREWLAQAVGAAHAQYLAQACQRFEVAAGEVVARQGDPADSMHFILEGRVSVVVAGDGGRKVRVRSLGRHTTIGEMGLITGRARSATIEAEVASVLYVLTANAFAHIKRTHPALSQALLTYVIVVMAERLSFANRAIGALQR